MGSLRKMRHGVLSARSVVINRAKFDRSPIWAQRFIRLRQAPRISFGTHQLHPRHIRHDDEL